MKEGLVLLMTEDSLHKLDVLAEHYGISRDHLAQKYLVDNIDDMYEAVLLAPKRREEAR